MIRTLKQVALETKQCNNLIFARRNFTFAHTVGDKCDAKGNCKGSNLCANVVCKAKSQCHKIGSCNFSTGLAD